MSTALHSRVCPVGTDQLVCSGTVPHAGGTKVNEAGRPVSVGLGGEEDGNIEE